MIQKILWRAARDDYVDTGYSFAETRQIATAYLDNPGFGGTSLYRTTIDVQGSKILDWTEMTMRAAADELDEPYPGAIGLDEYLPRTPSALDEIRRRGYLWVLVAESFPRDTTTWIWAGNFDDTEPELTEA